VEVVLRDHQHKLIQSLAIDPRKNLIFVAGTGSGKTISAIVAGMCALHRGIVDGVTIVTPVGVSKQFEDEVHRLVPVDHQSAFTFRTHKQYFQNKNEQDFESLRGKLLVIDEAHNLSTEITDTRERVVRGRAEITLTTSFGGGGGGGGGAQPAEKPRVGTALAKMMGKKFGLRMGTVRVRIHDMTPNHIDFEYKFRVKEAQLHRMHSVVHRHQMTKSPFQYFVSPSAIASFSSSPVEIIRRLAEVKESHVVMLPLTSDDDVLEEIDKGKIAHGATEAARCAEKVLLLTATPMKNSPVDMFNLVCMVQQARWKEFYQAHQECRKELDTLLRAKPNGFLRTGNMKLLRNYDLRPERECDHYLAIARRSVQFANATLEGFPEKRVKDVSLIMDDEYLKDYEEAEEQVMTESQHHGDEMLFNPEMKNVFYTKIRRAVNGITTTHTSAKIDYAIRLVKQHRAERILIYSNFKDGGLSLIQRRLRSNKDSNNRPDPIDTLRIDGDVSATKRKASVDQLNDPTNPANVLLISAAGGEGLDLKQVRHVVLLEPHWHEVRLEQVIGRAVRYRSHAGLPEGQRNVTVHMLRLSKPEGRKGLRNMESADDMLHTMAERKAVFIQWYLGGLNAAKATAHAAATAAPTTRVDVDLTT
jgi:superfamily II DNA or RNA helicase